MCAVMCVWEYVVLDDSRAAHFADFVFYIDKIYIYMYVYVYSQGYVGESLFFPRDANVTNGSSFNQFHINVSSMYTAFWII